MMSMVRKRILAGALVLVALAVFGFCERRAGVKAGAVDQEIKASAIVVKAARADVDVELKKSIAKRKEYHAARAKIQVKGDTVVADGQSVVLPAVAGFVRVADSRGDQDSTSIRKQDLLVAATDHHVDLVQEMKKPRCGKNCGIAIGVVGTVGTVYVVFRVIDAIAKAHK